ncbi:MAG: glucose-6-phosphate isomerase [Ruminococcaceae bacterium]|jgi:glucose-6-phosphate isomerase|nr:glucose-6-phosphate isomerase [Oscillospiraceae bacterium]
MALRLNETYLGGFVSSAETEKIAHIAEASFELVKTGTGAGSGFLGWVDLPVNYDREEYDRIKAASAKIQKMCDVFVVIGIGGSYLGARAAVEFCKSPYYNNLKKDTPEIYFAGNSISSSALSDIVRICEGRDVCINVISKSGTTTEPAVTFRIFREIMERKYGEEGARERIFVTTDRAKGKLKEFSTEKGYETFVVPDDIGGRYSVLTAVGLLPIAVAGIDIDAMMKGAADAREKYLKAPVLENDAVRYAMLRNILYNKGKIIELLVSYEPAAQMFTEWWKQLYGESEGKDEKGLYPASVIFSTDLHSLGQYVQSGLRTMFETVLDFKKSADTVVVPDDPNNIDGLNFLSGKELHDVNRMAMTGTLFAHNDGGVPNILIEADGRDAENFGHLVYFFELACAVSGYMLGVNPFDQPGVEAYKKNMYALLGKPGYEEQKAELEKRMQN